MQSPTDTAFSMKIIPFSIVTCSQGMTASALIGIGAPVVMPIAVLAVSVDVDSALRVSPASARMLLARSNGISSASTQVLFILIRFLSEGEAFRGT